MEEFDTMNIELDEYEISNLIGMMRRADEHDNGDWYCQILHKLLEAVKGAGIERLRNNFEDDVDVAEFEALFGVGKWRIGK